MRFLPKQKKDEKSKEKDESREKPKSDIKNENITDTREENSKLNSGKKGLFGFKSGTKTEAIHVIGDKSQVSTLSSKEEENKKLNSETKVVQEPVKSQQAMGTSENFTEQQIGKLIQIISAEPDNTIKPIINFEESTASYPALKEFGDDLQNTSVLEQLSSPQADILEKGVFERLAVCPEHPQHFAIILRRYCSACMSLDITKLELHEHKACGYIAERKEFGITSENDLITKCPSCKNTIRNAEKEIRQLGMWYQCNSCATKFDNCIMKLHCRKFDHDFDINQAGTLAIPYFKAKKESKTIKSYIFSLLPQIKKQITSHGFTVDESATVKGKSGVVHKISLYAYDNKNKTIIVEIKSLETEITETEMESMLGKVFDISPTFAIFIGIPSISEQAKAMAKAYKISTITGQNFVDILNSVESTLKDLIVDQL
jgi:predicted RNA-binding Zn-ribbon protein involved in translation (DUF1610 family)